MAPLFICALARSPATYGPAFNGVSGTHPPGVYRCRELLDDEIREIYRFDGGLLGTRRDDLRDHLPQGRERLLT